MKNDRNIFVSIIIPTYNYGSFISDTIDSILQQTYSFYEVIVVNDASTDDTEQKIKKYPQITYIRHAKNKGFAQTMNTGLMHAKGIFSVVVSADDLLEKNFLKKSVTFLRQHPTAVLVHSPSRIINAQGIILRKQHLLHLPTIISNGYEQLVLGNFLSLVSVVFRTDIAKRVGGFSSQIRQMPDWDMWLRLSRHGSLGYLPEYLTRYRIHNKSLTAEIKHNIVRIGKERSYILKNTIQSHIPPRLRLFMPLLFLDAYISRCNLPNNLSFLLAFASLVISVITTKIGRVIFPGKQIA